MHLPTQISQKQEYWKASDACLELSKVQVTFCEAKYVDSLQVPDLGWVCGDPTSYMVWRAR